MNKGRIVQVMGPVVDVVFENGDLPFIKDALEVDNNGKKCIMEVAQHLGNNEVRCLMLAASEGLCKDMEVTATGAGIQVPVGEQTLGRLFNVLGETIDNGEPITDSKKWVIHREPPTFEEQSPVVEILETGIKVIDLLAPYAKGGNFKDALEFWKIAYNECPASTKDLYLYGVRIVSWQIENEKDPAKKAQLVNDLMTVYDKRIKYFGNDRKYGKDWIIGNKAEDYVKYAGDNLDANALYDWTKSAIDEKGDKCEVKAVSYFMFASLRKMQADPNFKDQYIQDYLKAASIIDAQIKVADPQRRRRRK